jgi:gamma-glutamyltranspeptidase/glutathione hydrolase
MEEELKAMGHTRIRGFGASLKANALRRIVAEDGSVSWESARDPRVEPKLAYE